MSSLFLYLLASSVSAETSDTNRIISELKNVGASISRVSKSSEELEVEFHLTGCDLTDDQLAPIAELAAVKYLNLRDTRITDAGLKHLRGLRNLETLHAERTAITDKGTAQLAGLSKLSYLNLYGTKVGDATLEHFTNLKKLRRLYLWQTNVTDAGVAKLQKALPGVEIIRGLDLVISQSSRNSPPEPTKPTGSLKFVATDKREAAPISENGENTTIVFENKSGQTVRLYWIDYGNELKLYATLKPDEKREQNSYENNSWLITNEKDGPLGYFVATAEVTTAVIPPIK